MRLQAICLCVASITLAAGKSKSPCCSSCPEGKKKYYSIPSPSEANPQCGECCLDPKKIKMWKLFEPKLEEGDCSSHGYTKYVSTETDGFPPLAVTNDRFTREECPDNFRAIYADMHDGDKKEVYISGTSMTIKPSGNNQNWTVQATLDRKSCSAMIDFNVPGKPSPPPMALKASVWYSWVIAGWKTELEFTDPSGKLASETFPLNRWVELNLHDKIFKMGSCPPDSYKAVFADMHDGDKKEIIIKGDSMTIKSSGTNQTWVVNSQLDRAFFCNANINFKVPGKPSPPPGNLTGRFWYNIAAGQQAGTPAQRAGKLVFEFTDPADYLYDLPLNQWVELGASSEEVMI